MKLSNLQRTCIACPSAWEGETEDGREVYIRYRYGQLVSYIGSPSLIEPVWKNETVILREIVEVGSQGDGSMDTSEMLEQTGFEYEGETNSIDEDLYEIDKQNEEYFNSDHGDWLENLADKRKGDN